MSFFRYRLPLPAALLAAATMIRAAAQDLPDPEKVIGTFESISGVHKGERRNHAKGVCVVGSFTGTAAARALSKSQLFSGQQIPLVGRFSVAGPNPSAPDTTKSPRGMALQFRLPDGELHQTAMLNTPVFGAAAVQSFLDRQTVDVPDPATGKKDPAKLQEFVRTHPDNKGQADWLSSHNPAPSYANITYYSLNAFKFVAADGGEHWVKWRFVPKDGEAFLSDAELAAAPKDFLTAHLEDRLTKGSIGWKMIVTVGQDGDPIDNPSVAWPTDRPEILAGELTLTKGGKDAAGQCEDINFDPNLLSDGVEPSPDQILQYRSAAYGLSYQRREEERGK